MTYIITRKVTCSFTHILADCGGGASLLIRIYMRVLNKKQYQSYFRFLELRASALRRLNSPGVSECIPTNRKQIEYLYKL